MHDSERCSLFLERRETNTISILKNIYKTGVSFTVTDKLKFFCYSGLCKLIYEAENV